MQHAAAHLEERQWSVWPFQQLLPAIAHEGSKLGSTLQVLLLPHAAIGRQQSVCIARYAVAQAQALQRTPQ